MLLADEGRRDAVSLTELSRQLRQRLCRRLHGAGGEGFRLEPARRDSRVDPARTRDPLTLRYRRAQILLDLSKAAPADAKLGDQCRDRIEPMELPGADVIGEISVTDRR
jgi:hypothetical protein